VEESEQFVRRWKRAAFSVELTTRESGESVLEEVLSDCEAKLGW